LSVINETSVRRKLFLQFDSKLASESWEVQYVLKGAHIIVSPYFVVVTISENEVQSRTGIFTHRLDKLQLKTVENIEIVSTLLGRVFNYSTILLYAHGSWVRLPYVVQPDEIKKQIESNLENVRSK